MTGRTVTAPLALWGAEPIRTTDFPAWPQWDDAERDGLVRAVEQGQWWRVGGKEVEQFETEFAAFHGAPAALAVTNGTVAIELALELLGIEPGDEVVVPAFTFISTSMAVQRRGAVPVPVDIELDTYCLDPASFAAAVTDRTRAVIPVHMAGHFVDMDGLDEVAAKASVTVIQDAAHAHGAQWNGRGVGEFGSVATFSFQNGKLMTAGEGGAILLPSAAEYDAAFMRHSCGRPVGDRVYDHRTLSGNLRLSEFSGAVLRAQLARLPMQLERRESRWKVLDAALREIPGIVPQSTRPAATVHSRYMAMFHLGPELDRVDRNTMVDALIAEGIPAFVNYPPVYRTRAFWERSTPPMDEQALAEACPNSELIGARGIWVHHRTLLGTDEDALDVARAVERVIAALGS